MKVVFWGVRGSAPAPLTGEQVQAKISAAVMRIQRKDIESADARERFLANLPGYIYGTAGGNTPCVQVVANDSSQIILDAGTGARVLAKRAEPPKNGRYSFLLSHLHWDHIQGFPFFDAIYDPRVTIDIYSPAADAKERFARQMSAPFFPVDFGSIKSRVNFFTVEPGKEFRVGSAKINCCLMRHPGGSCAYSISDGGKKFVYATDVELRLGRETYGKDAEAVFFGANAAALDSQYTMMEAVEKENWGHSPFAYAIDFAAQMQIDEVFLFHHEPEHSDKTLDAVLQAANWYAKFIAQAGVKARLAVEGGEIEL